MFLSFYYQILISVTSYSQELIIANKKNFQQIDIFSLLAVELAKLK